MISSIKINPPKQNFPFNIIILEEIRKIKKSNIAQIPESIYNRQKGGEGLENLRNWGHDGGTRELRAFLPEINKK